MTAVASLSSDRDRDVLRSFARRIDASDAGAHNNLGVLYYNKGLYEEAVSAFMKALELDQRMEVAQRNLEIAYFTTGYYDRRIPDLRERLRLKPDDREARWELGRTSLLLGRTQEAVEQLRLLLQYYPSDVAALMQLALAEKQLGNLDRAQERLERAIALDADSSLLHFTLGEVLYHRGFNAEALRALERALELNATNHDALYLMGFVLGDMGRHEDARAVTKRAVKLNPAFSRPHANLAIETDGRDSRGTRASLAMAREPQVSADSALTHYNLGLAFRSKGYYGEALREYGIALERGEARDLVLQAMAESHLLRQCPGDALPLYDELVAGDANSPKLWNERGIALHQLGQVEAAEADYRRSAAADPRYALAHNNLAVARYQRGAIDDAVASLRAALDAQPTFVKARLNLAVLLLRARRFSQALETYRQVLAGEPENPVAWNGVGLVLSEHRKFEDARNAFGRAIETSPLFAEAHYNLSFALSNLGDFEGALRETKRALELDPYYVAQKLALAIDVEYEGPDLAVPPDLGMGDQRTDGGVEQFVVDSAALDTVFVELAAASPAATPPGSRAVPEPEASPYALATDYLSKGLYDRTMAEVGRAMTRGASRVDGLTLLAEVYARQGLHGEALDRFREARRIDYRHRPATLGEAWALVRMSRGREARPIVESLLRASPEDVDVLVLAATACAEAGDPGAALTHLEVARRVAPMRADVQQTIGDIARSLGDNERAIGAYRHALELDPAFAMVRYKLSQVLEGKGLLREAEQELRAAIDAVPTFGEATLALATLVRKTGDPETALDLLVDLLRRDPYHFDGLICLGETLLALNRRDDAGVAFGRVLRFDPTHAGALFHHGAILAEQRRYAEAIAAWQTVIDLQPSSSFAKRARSQMRTATDLQRILGNRGAQ
jgi:tetratricopeptide (TPR) repeat protein